MRRRAVALGAAATALGALAAVHMAGGGPPLYDGLCTAPAYLRLGATPAPPTATALYSASQLAGTLELADNETTPQAQVIMGAGTLTPAAGAATVTLTISPVKAPATRPNGSIDGNVYDFAATSAGQAVQAAPAHPVTIALGATSSGGPALSLEHFDGSRWIALKTFQSGCGTTYDAASPTLGLFALVAPGGSTAGGGSPAGSGPSALVFVLGAVVLIGLVIGGVRTARTRR